MYFEVAFVSQIKYETIFSFHLFSIDEWTENEPWYEQTEE